MEKILSMRPFTPPLEDMEPYLRRIWDSRWLTNGGSIHKELEVSLCDHLGIEYISLVSSGTLALILALKSLDLKGEIITTPFTSVATAQAIHWNGLKPVFVDINEKDLNINTEEIEKAVSRIHVQYFLSIFTAIPAIQTRSGNLRANTSLK